MRCHTSVSHISVAASECAYANSKWRNVNILANTFGFVIYKHRLMKALLSNIIYVMIGVYN